MDFPSGPLPLELADLAQVSTVSHKGTLGLFAIGKKGKQKITIGDDSGTIHCYEMKRGGAQPVFSSRITEGGDSGGGGGSGSMITAVAMGGNSTGLGGGDRVFATQGSSIVGLSKKGKEFFRMASPVSETIHHMAVENERIWIGCDNICSAYDNGQDTAFYMCQDKITSLTTGKLTGKGEKDVVLGCKDNCIRVIQAVGSNVAFQALTDGPVSAICAINDTGEGVDQATGGIVCGTDQGTLSHFAPTPSGAQHLRKLWQLPPGGSLSRGGIAGRGITAIKHFDLTNDGVAELVAGREDGTITVYRFSAAGKNVISSGRLSTTQNSAPNEMACINLGQSVRSLEAGRVSSDEQPEVVACTYRGRVCSVKNQAPRQLEEEDAFGRSVGVISNENHVKQLKKEVSELEKRLAIERKKLAVEATKDNGKASAAYTPATQHFQAITSCTLDPEQGAYLISVETPVPLDLVLIHSQVHMDILRPSDPEKAEQQEMGCMRSLSPEDGGGVCATYHFEGDAATRLCIRARTTEGDYGDVRMTVVANMQHTKSAQVIHFCMKPLSLHHRIHKIDRLAKRPLNSLVLRGNFTMQVAHDWLAMCLPELPSRCPMVPDEAEGSTLEFENVFTGGVLIASYKRGVVVLRSDSASTLAIVKEQISKEATARRVHITDAFQGEPESIPAFLNLLYPKLTAQFLLSRQVELMDALKEISMQERDTSWMFDEYRYILDNADIINQEFQGRPRTLEYISGIVTDLYVDWHKFQGDDARHHIPNLERMLVHQCDYAALVAFFLKRP